MQLFGKEELSSIGFIHSQSFFSGADSYSYGALQDPSSLGQFYMAASGSPLSSQQPRLINSAPVGRMGAQTPPERIAFICSTFLNHDL